MDAFVLAIGFIFCLVGIPLILLGSVWAHFADKKNSRKESRIIWELGNENFEKDILAGRVIMVDGQWRRISELERKNHQQGLFDPDPEKVKERLSAARLEDAARTQVVMEAKARGQSMKTWQPDPAEWERLIAEAKAKLQKTGQPT